MEKKFSIPQTHQARRALKAELQEMIRHQQQQVIIIRKQINELEKSSSILIERIIDTMQHQQAVADALLQDEYEALNKENP